MKVKELIEQLKILQQNNNIIIEMSDPDDIQYGDVGEINQIKIDFENETIILANVLLR